MNYPMVFFICQVLTVATELMPVAEGVYVPFAKEMPEQKVESFQMQKHAVTNEDFLRFVQSAPKYRRSKVPNLMADQNYLRDWTDDLTPPDAKEHHPVTNVSWYVANAYCRHLGMELPTTAQWELAASAKDYEKQILDWYSAPGASDSLVMSTFANVFGIWDLHGLIWEWVLDFDSEAPVQAEAFCGASAGGTADVSNYTAFIRYGLRSSLKANYTVRNMGFRCAQNE